jgi:hypothetical protein
MKQLYCLLALMIKQLDNVAFSTIYDARMDWRKSAASNIIRGDMLRGPHRIAGKEEERES